MLETLVPTPTSGLVTKFMDEYLVFGSFNWIIGFVGVVFGIMSPVSYLWPRFMYFACAYFESSVIIETEDQLYTYVMAWLTQSISTRWLQAKTARGGEHSLDDPASMAEYASAVMDGEFNLLEWQKVLRPRYEPHHGEISFMYQGRRLRITRVVDNQFISELSNQLMVDRKEYIKIHCWSKSPEPIQDFIQHTKSVYLDREGSKTRIYEPKPTAWTPKWIRVSNRPSRSIASISLDKTLKNGVLEDVREFLRPGSIGWYARRGIPYRRGYLLYGPPGTGKTSFSMALAGVFGLSIYCLSLGDPSMTEDRLLTYFGELPNRCILLIEDIDTASISKRRTGGDAASGDKSAQVSLSCLLNAIDGVASHEGRILIMTTNHPEQLDPALTRDGRVDLKIPFGLASKEQMVSIFTNMYMPENEHGELERHEDKVDGNTREAILAAAEAFGDLLPPGEFSPAEIQGFLMVRRGSHMKALMEVEKWRDEVRSKRGQDDALGEQIQSTK
ncbi:hypothetical protein H072_5304 [Dactylellina haptotyla CBS 200.50]|uniref:AAA+ ATPase domain-containing protein n=1 Tax=Dactylellina haptotyla (strain CBS 200.50) TaxID=1284197 RepID=S8ACT4_DACHA|nr:hypothetical protein H072_5304 [Dactylellina haptotyla CBS 200.50]